MANQAKKRARPRPGQAAPNGFADPNKAEAHKNTGGRSVRAVNWIAATSTRLYSATKRLGLLYVDGSAISIGRAADGYQRAASRTKIKTVEALARRQASAARELTNGYVSAARVLAS